MMQSAQLVMLRRFYSQFVPPFQPPAQTDIQKIQEFLKSKQRVFVLTGAGISTESGIPDYRSEGVGLYARTDRRPMNHQDFMKSKLNRQRFWARNYVGWPQFSSFQPNVSHHVIEKWRQQGRLKCLVTQNVDALHRKAGSHSVLELHGCSHHVACLLCYK